MLLMTCLFIGIGLVNAQVSKVTGTVTSHEDGLPVVGASVLVKGTQVGTVTDIDGNFTITNVPSSAGTLVISFIGMKTQEVAIQKIVKVELHSDSELLDEVTVVAYGTKRKQDLVGSISSVKKEIISNSQATSVTNALEGTVAGLQIVSSTGQPGSDASIVLRGIGSLSASNEALIVVDGVPFNGRLSDINPADIASINVSKDAVSNSLYGSRAAGGVVMVTTKSGSKDKVSINFNGTWGVTQRAYKDYNMVTDPGEFYRLTWYGIRNTQWASGMSIEDANLEASKLLLSELGNYNAFIIPEGEYLVTPDGNLNTNARLRYNDTFADALFNNAFRQEYNVSASGGNDKTDYYVSMGYLDNDSYVLGSSYNRFTARANINSQLKSWLKVGTNVGYSKTTQNGVQEGAGLASNPFSVARSWAPIYPVHAYDAEGNMKYYENGEPMYDAGNGETDGTGKRPTATNQNVIANMNEDIRENVYNNLTSRSYIEISFLKNFKFTANYSYDFTNNSSTTYYTPLIGDGQSFGGRGTKGSYNTITTNFNQILAYSNAFGNHHLSAKMGHEAYKYEFKYLEGQKTNFFNPNNPELVNGGQMQYIDSYTVDHNIEGYFVMADYDYDNKYYLSAAFRRDGTSRFLNRWGNFWSVGGAWRISKEEFMNGTESWLNDLKLRASYGTQGNENILSGYSYAYTPYMDQYQITWNGSELGYSPIFYGNPDLTWEKQNTFDVGVDFRLFDRLYGSFEYFYRRTDDMLFQRPVAFSTAGRPYNWENLGAMKNAGIEFDLNVDIFNRPDLKWTVSVVGSHYKNRILTLPEENRKDGITDGLFNLREGKSRYEYYTYMYAGMNEEGKPMWYKDELNENNEVVGRTTTTTYADATKYFLGKSALPDFNGGLNTTFSYKGIDLSIATAFQIGGYAYDYSYLDGMSQSFYVGHNKDMWDTFNPETGKGKLPIWNANDSGNSFTQSSDLNLIKASYFSIRNITLGYTLPKNLMKKISVEKMRIYVTADNFALWSKRQGFDPRVSMAGASSSYGGYSPMRVISGGINLSF